MRGGPVYIVKPKYIFKHPFNKYDLANPTNRETQNQELTDYFNYGFNEDTMNIYGKLVKRFIEVLDHHKNLEYFNEPSELMRLNDEIPMDFGGFCKFHDPSIVDKQTPENFHDGQTLMRYFIMMIFANASKKIEYPLIQFVKNMYKKEGEEETQDTALFDIIEQIGKNLEEKYQETMAKLIQKQNQSKIPVAQKKGPARDREDKRDRTDRDNRESRDNRDNRDNRDRDRDRNDRGDKLDRNDREKIDREKEKQREREREREKEKEKEREKQKELEKIKDREREREKIDIKKQKSEKEHNKNESSSGSDDSSSESSDSNSQAKKRKRQKGQPSKSDDRAKKKSKKKDRDHDRKKKDNRDKDKKDKHKTKKVKKQKSRKRSRSRDKKKKHH